MPIYLAYFLLGLEAERLQAFASFPLVAVLLSVRPFAIYRARRYRLTRTVWRGVRFWMNGSGWAYAWRAALWGLLMIVTLGLALPWREAALERYKMRHTYYGDLQGSFEGRGWEFFKRGWWLWLLTPLALYVIPLRRSSMRAFKAMEWRWWLSGIRFGDVRLESNLPRSAADRPLLEGDRLDRAARPRFRGLSGGCRAALVASMSGDRRSGSSSPSQEFVQEHSAAGADGPRLSGVGAGVQRRDPRLSDARSLGEGAGDSIDVHDIAAAANVAAQGELASALGEGFADSLDVAGSRLSWMRRTRCFDVTAAPRSISTARRTGGAAVTLRFADALEIAERRRDRWRAGPMPTSAAPTVRRHAAAALRDARRRWRGSKSAMPRCGRSGRALHRASTSNTSRPPRRCAIVGWSLAAAVSIVAVVLFGVPLAADRLAPLVPQAFERRLGEAADKQVKTIFGGKVCDGAAGQAAFAKLVDNAPRAGGLDTSVQSARAVDAGPQCLRAAGRQGLSVRRAAGEGRQCRRDRRRARARARPSQAPRQHARADPQRRHLVPDRPAVRRRHRLRRAGLRLAHAGHASYSREAESAADASRSKSCTSSAGRPKPMGDLMLRVTGKEGGRDSRSCPAIR